MQLSVCEISNLFRLGSTPQTTSTAKMWHIWTGAIASEPSFLLNAYTHLRHRKHWTEPFPVTLGERFVKYESHLFCESPEPARNLRRVHRTYSSSTDVLAGATPSCVSMLATRVHPSPSLECGQLRAQPPPRGGMFEIMLHVCVDV